MSAPFRLETLGSLRLSGPDGELLAGRRKELALLVYIARRSPRAVRRDELIALFWGERNEENARASLRQALLQLRRGLGESALQVGPTDARLREQVLTLDAARFEELAAAGSDEEAVRLWHGDFMLGLESAGDEDFRLWLDVERERLRRLLHSSFQRAVAATHARGDFAAMAELAKRWSEHFPFEEEPALHLVTALSLQERWSDARAQYAAYDRRLREELEFEPSDRWRDLGVRLAQEDAKPLLLTAPPASPAPQAAIDHATSAARSRFGFRSRLAAAFVVVLAFGGWGLWLYRWLQPHTPVIAVGNIRVSGVPDSMAAFPLLLTTDLARIPNLSVISEGRLREVQEYLRQSSNGKAELQEAARQAGASEILEGVLSRRSGGNVRIDLHRVDLETGATRGAFTIESADVFDLVDLTTERIAADLGARAPAARPRATTTSLVAYRLYEEGLRFYYQNSPGTAQSFFRSAVAEDSTFAMATYYLAQTLPAPESWDLMARAVRLSERASPRESLTIRTAWAMQMQEPRRLALAESLATRYSHEPESHLLYAAVLTYDAQFARANDQLRLAFALDSISLRSATERCGACNALGGLINNYTFLDSLPAAERIAREWIRLQPRSHHAWISLSRTLEPQDKHEEALAAMRTAGDLGGQPQSDPGSGVWIRSGEFERVNRLWSDLLESGNRDQRQTALFGQTINFRTQGRLREALQAAQRYRLEAADPPNLRYSVGAAFLEGIVRFELGEFARSAAIFDSMAVMQSAPSVHFIARNRAWALTHAASAIAAARDTTRLRLLEDSIRMIGALSAYARDQRLHHYVRGLRLQAQGRLPDAVEAFRRSLFSPTEGYARAYLELARSLATLNRHQEAIAVLRSALHGPIAASGLYATRTDLQELLGLSYEASGQPDSAATQYKKVLKAWRGVDPQLESRRRDIVTRLSRIAHSAEPTTANR